jgi:putative ABC transport system substrate-binding protein
VKRRRVVTVLGAVAAVSPFLAVAQARPRIAYLSGRSQTADAHLLEAFRQGLKNTGFVDGQNVTMDVRWADGRYGEIGRMAEELVATKPDLIVAVGGNPVGLAAKAATSTIPVVFGAGADPVAIGLVKSLSRPEANVTGMTLFANLLDAKRMELLHDMLPATRKVALLVNPTNPGTQEMTVLSRATAAKLGMDVTVYEARSTGEIERAFLALAAQAAAGQKLDALAVGADAFLINSRLRILELAAAQRLPAIYPAREFAIDGGLASYGTRWADMYRLLGNYAGRILKGAKPSDLPVLQPATYEFVINQKTAQSLGLQLPLNVLGRTDELIE